MAETDKKEVRILLDYELNFTYNETIDNLSSYLLFFQVGSEKHRRREFETQKTCRRIFLRYTTKVVFIVDSLLACGHYQVSI